MKKIGVFICNYNGKEDLLNCIHSLFRQTIREFDIHVVDNASTDGTVETLQEQFGDQVAVICNPENLGGAGGFDRGLRTGLEKQYEYIVLLDNDIVLEENVLENMCIYLDTHGEVGLVGSKVMIMDRPDVLQDYGDYLDFEIFRERFGYGGHKDDESLPPENECDYVPSCAIMIRSEILKKSGTMPVDNFIYYDDIELSHKIRLSGGRIVALGNAKVWHKGGFRKETVNTFGRYYFLRNRLHFFAKYISDEEIERFVDAILQEVFSQLAGFYSKGMREVFVTTMYAFDDFLHQVRGKAADDKILQILPRETPFVKVLRGEKSIIIKFLEGVHREEPLKAYQALLRILEEIQKNEPRNQVWISLEQCGCGEEEFRNYYQKAVGLKKPEYSLPELLFTEQDMDSCLILRMCRHVKEVEKPVFPEIYVDQYCNCIASEEDYYFFTEMEVNKRFFVNMYRPLMMRAVKSIREGMKNEK